MTDAAIDGSWYFSKFESGKYEDILRTRSADKSWVGSLFVGAGSRVWDDEDRARRRSSEADLFETGRQAIPTTS